MGPGTDDSAGNDSVAERAELLPEERVVGSEDPAGQAAAILEESEARTVDPVPEEERTSEDVVEPPS
jgi:hypothetical protein